MNKRAIGSRYESLAAAFLETEGCEILERNFHCREGEIDLIARDGAYLVFVEVKYRSSLRCGSPAEAVGLSKIRHIRAAALAYLSRCPDGEKSPCRFDVVEILGNRIHHIKDAF